MAEYDPKTEAVDALLDLKAGTGVNPHSARLDAAFGQKQAKRLPDFDKIRRAVLKRRDAIEAERRRFRRVWIPAAAAAVALFAVGIFVLNQKPQAPSPLAQAVEISPGKSQDLRIAESLGIHIRSGINVTQKLDGTSLVLKADAIAALFDFEPNEKLRTVRIETPRASFAVIGTRFIIEADKEKSFLAVESGAVRVEASGKEGVIRGGEFWSKRKDSERTGKTGATGQKLFKAFAEDRETVAFVSAVQGSDVPAQQRSERRISITLKSGSVVSGTLISEGPNGVEVRAANQVLRFKKEEIASME